MVIHVLAIVMMLSALVATIGSIVERFEPDLGNLLMTVGVGFLVPSSIPFICLIYWGF